MIYITGDVHSRIGGHWEQEKSGDEIFNTIKYLKILKKYKLKSTLFINGVLLDNSSEKIKGILEYDVELGGHTYDNFSSMRAVKSYVYRKLWGCIYGPESFQKRDIMRTKRAFKRRGLKMTSWRTHAFGSNEKTFEILQKEGVRHVSDLLGRTDVFESGGIVHVPVNIPVDIVTISVGPWRPENRDPFASCTKGRIEPEEWFDIIKKRVIENEKNGKNSVLLLHPITMAALDNFEMFEKICSFLSQFESDKISNLKL